MQQVPARAWLPEAAVCAVAIDAALADVARAWSAKWFATRIVRPLDTLGEKAIPSPVGCTWLTLERDLAIALPAEARMTIAAWMLNLELPPEPPTAEDERVLTDLAQTCLDDLCRRLAEAFKLDRGARWSRVLEQAAPDATLPVSCAIGVDGRTPLLRIAVAHDVLVGLAKIGLAPPPKPQPLSSLAHGLAAQDIAISAYIGCCALTLADVGALGIGDVLVFDRAADAPLDVLIDGGGTLVTRCTVARSGDGFDLTLLEAIGKVL